MNARLVVGTNAEGVNDKIAATVRSLLGNKVTALDSRLLTDVVPLLPSCLQQISEVHGLRLILRKKPTMAHSGWVYSRFLDICRRLTVDPTTTLAVYSDGFFREFGQFGAMEPEVLFLGFGQMGARMLAAILEAESQFNASEFDPDGYAV